MRRVLALLALGALALAAVLVVRAVSAGRGAPAPAPAAAVELDEEALAARLAAALRFATVAPADEAAPLPAAFAELRAHLAATYPRVHAALAPEAVGGRALLFSLAGSEPDLPPALLLAHLDVVPVDEGARAAWTHPPFAGVVADGFVWGRGALDDKAGACALLEALERTLADGARPRRGVLVSLGLDEEVGGAGARAVAALLAERGVRPWAVLDEGQALLDGFVPGLDAPVAAVGVAEKGQLVLELRARAPGGHASIPTGADALSVLEAALGRLRAARAPGGYEGLPRAFLEGLLPELPLDRRLVLANAWLFAPLIERQLAARPPTDALLRTTAAVTMVTGGVAPNVLAETASAVVDLRVHPREDVDAALARVRRVVGDERVELVVRSRREPAPVSSTEHPAYALVADAARAVEPRAVATPALVLGLTDSRHFTGLCDAVYRFRCLRLAPRDLERIHGNDERVAVADYARLVRFELELLRRL